MSRIVEAERVLFTRRRALLGVAGMACGFLASFLSAAPLRPNIILAMADDMGWGDPHYHSSTVTYANGLPHPDQGWISTPTLDTMAASGLRFNRFYSGSAVCSPTRGSCLTGRSPFRLGIPDANEGRLAFDEVPLSKVLSAAGYRCAHFGKWHLGTLTTLTSDGNRAEPGVTTFYSAPWHHGYDFCFVTEAKVPTYDPYRKGSFALPTSFSDTNFYGSRYWRMPLNPADWSKPYGEGDAVPVEEVNNPINGDDSKLLVDRVIPYMQQSVSNGQPFFVVLWFHTPHAPVRDPAGVSNNDTPGAAKRAIQDLDLAIGRLRNELDTLGVRANTMFWFTSDNGPEGGLDSFNETDTERSIRSGRFLKRKRSLHEGGVRVPSILEWPDKIPAPRQTEFAAVTSDYYLTILDFLELSAPSHKPLDGVSLRPVIEGAAAANRAKPIGFKFRTQNSWVGQQYKLYQDTSDANGWMLYDLINIPAGEEVEQPPLATAANIGTTPQAIKDIYYSMLAEFNAWDASVSNDTPCIHASQPSVALTTPSPVVSNSFTVHVTFSKSIDRLRADAFAVTNGVASALSGAGTNWALTVTPIASGLVSIRLPEGAVVDAGGIPNGPSAVLQVACNWPNVVPLPSVVTTLFPSATQTVDATNNVPGDRSNNLSKFTAGTTYPPYTTTVYIRNCDPYVEQNLRRVRAFAKFDLAALAHQPVSRATLLFNGYALNSGNADNIELIPLAANWEVSGTPRPAYSHATMGTAISGGSIIAGIDPVYLTRDYRFDVTSVIRNWAAGVWPNYGLQLRLENDAFVNNGLGIRPTGAGALRLVVEQAPLAVLAFFENGDHPSNLTIIWNSAPGANYQVQASDIPAGGWQPVANVAGGTGGATSFTHMGGMDGRGRRFYRVAYVPN